MINWVNISLPTPARKKTWGGFNIFQECDPNTWNNDENHFKLKIGIKNEKKVFFVKINDISAQLLCN